MVDERIMVEGLDDSTKLITLTSEEAFKYKIADTVIADFKNLLNTFNLKNAEEIQLTSNWYHQHVEEDCICEKEREFEILELIIYQI